MKNGKQIVLRATEGIFFRVQEEKECIVIEAINEYSSEDCSHNYKNPKIPKGYVHLCSTWKKGFVIQNQEDKSEFTWVPVDFLDNDATLDGEHFDEKFGRKNWENSNFSESGYHEEVSQDFVESVKKYGGFYFASFHASKEDGKLVFKKGNMPLTNINYHDAEDLAANYARGSEDVVSQITSGAAFDTVLRWIRKSIAKTYSEVVEDSSSWGNYLDNVNSTKELMPTGSHPNWCVCNIYDLAGNVNEWTSEMVEHNLRVLRGCSFRDQGKYIPVIKREFNYTTDHAFDTSFRAVLYLK